MFSSFNTVQVARVHKFVLICTDLIGLRLCYTTESQSKTDCAIPLGEFSKVKKNRNGNRLLLLVSRIWQVHSFSAWLSSTEIRRTWVGLKLAVMLRTQETALGECFWISSFDELSSIVDVAVDLTNLY